MLVTDMWIRKLDESKIQQRGSARLRGYDYSRSGGYFVTIPVQGQRWRMGTLKNVQVNLSLIGIIVDACWQHIFNRYAKVEVDTFIVMPNHLHGVLFIHNLGRGEAFEGRHETAVTDSPSNASPVRVSRGTKSGSLGAIVQNFKSISTRRINQLCDTPGERFWQRGYYDRIIRNRQELDRIRKYIIENPAKWELDEYYSKQ